ILCRTFGIPPLIIGMTVVSIGTSLPEIIVSAAASLHGQLDLAGGAATLFYPMWHLEVESLLVLKNNRGVEGNRVRHMDYGVQIN
ncbi:hypothetical protein MJL33_34055, partial [Salmonella enterica subsp. enterica serovar Kentucky]|nr:hypothetical protein [Salmonella enterica subsp. enterica serovar Kentucky]